LKRRGGGDFSQAPSILCIKILVNTEELAFGSKILRVQHFARR
jgi:hypothetical protein